MDHVLGLDLGTSYFKALVVDEAGRCQGFGRCRTPKTTSGSETVISVLEFASAISACIREAINGAGVGADAIRAVSYASQANTFLLADFFDQPITDLYVWNTVFDTIPDPAMRHLWADPRFADTTGMGIDGPEMALAKVLWLRRHETDLWSRCRRFATISDWFVKQATGSWVSDAGTSAMLGLLDLRSGTWWDDALELVGLDRSLFAPVVPSGTIAGYVTHEGSRWTGLPAGIPVVCGSLDHVMAAIGAGIGAYAPVAESTGTVLAALGIGSEINAKEGICIGSYPLHSQWWHLAFHDRGAEAVETYRDRHFPGAGIDDMLSAVRGSPPGANGVRFADDQASGTDIDLLFSGRTGNRSDDLRSLLETIAWRTRLLCTTVTGSPDGFASVLATGGLNRNPELLEIKADIMNSEVFTCAQKELGAYGAAMLAACGCGLFDTLEGVQKSWISIDRRILPVADQVQAYKAYQAEVRL